MTRIKGHAKLHHISLVGLACTHILMHTYNHAHAYSQNKVQRLSVEKPEEIEMLKVRLWQVPKNDTRVAYTSNTLSDEYNG